MTTGYKLTTQNMTTHGDFKWALGHTAITSGEGDLCGPGWLHFYGDPLLAVLLNPIHANIDNPRLFEAIAGPTQEHDRGLKSGATQLTLIRELPLPAVTLAQRVAFAKNCAAFAAEVAKGPRTSPDEILMALMDCAYEAVS